MAQQKLREQIIELWDEMSGLSQDDPLFQKKRMFLFGKISIYTKIFSVICRIHKFFEN